MADLRHFHFVFTLRRLNPCFTPSMPHPTFSVIFKVQNIPYLSCSCERNVMLLARKESPSMTLQPHVGKVLWPKYKKKATARNKHNCTKLSANIYDYNNNCTMFNKLWLIIWKKTKPNNESLLAVIGWCGSPAERGGESSILCSRGQRGWRWLWRRTPASPQYQTDKERKTRKYNVCECTPTETWKTNTSCSFTFLYLYLVAPVKVQPLALRKQTHRQHLNNRCRTGLECQTLIFLISNIY